MKKRTLLFLSILATISFTSTAENLRESIAIVRPNFSESTQTFLTDFSKSLRTLPISANRYVKTDSMRQPTFCKITGKGRSGPDLPTGINETVGYTSSPTVMW